MKNKDIAFESKLMQFHSYLEKNKPSVISSIRREFNSVTETWDFTLSATLGTEHYAHLWQIRQDDFDKVKPKRLADRIIIHLLDTIINNYQKAL